MHVITGTIYTQPYTTFGNNVFVPSHLWKIVIDSKNLRSIAFLYPNQKLDPKEIEKYVVSISEIEQYTGINISPALPPQYQQLEKVRANYKDW